jgi:hypothetical protein
MEFSPASSISLSLVDPHASMTWTSTIDVYRYLLGQENARNYLRQEMQRRSPQCPRNFLIRHRFLPRGIILFSQGNDARMLDTIQGRLFGDTGIWLDDLNLEHWFQVLRSLLTKETKNPEYSTSSLSVST